MKEIPNPKIQTWFTPESLELKNHGIEYLSYLFSNQIDMSKVQALSSGESSAVFFIPDQNESTIVKFKTTGAVQEAEVLTAWKRNNVNVPLVKDIGTLNTKNTLFPVEFIILEGIATDEGKPAPIGYEFIDNNLNSATEIGEKMGEQIALAHSALIDIDTLIEPDLINNSSSAVLIEEYKEYLLSKGISTNEINNIIEILNNLDNSRNKSYVHGDFGIHNILIKPNNKMVYLIDPDPKIGNPYIDISPLIFRMATTNFMMNLCPDNEIAQRDGKKFKDTYQALIDKYFQINKDNFDPRMSSIYCIASTLPKIFNREKKLNLWINESFGEEDLNRAEILSYGLFLKDQIAQIT